MGLLDFMNTPQGMGLLSAVAGGLTGARRGTPINNIGRGLTAGVVGYNAAIDNERQAANTAIADKYRSMQMQQIEQEIERARAQREWKANLGNVMAPKLTGSTEQGRQLAEQNAVFGEEGLPDLVASAQYAATKERPDVPLNMNYGVDQQAVQQYMMHPDSPYADKLIERKYFPNKEDRTAEQKNFEYAQTLPPEQRELFMSRSGSGSTPAVLQEWEYFNRLDPQSQARYLEMKRNPQIMNLGGTQSVRAPGGGIAESYTVTPAITDMPSFQAAQARAKAEAEAGVTSGAEVAKKGRTADALLSNIDQAESILTTGKPSGSLVGAGVSAAKRAVGISDDTTSANQQLRLIAGWMVSNVPRMEGPQSNFDVQNYREMAATVGDETIPVKDRLAALQQLRVLQNKYKQVQQGGNSGSGRTLNRGEILGVELQDALARGDTQNANLIRQEMRRMGVKETTKPQPKPQKAQAFDLPPNASQYAGKTLTDTVTGKKFKSVNGKWQEVR